MTFWHNRGGRRSRRKPSRIHKLRAPEALESRRLLAAGWLDPSFGYVGYRAVDLGVLTGAGATDDFADAVAVQSDGKIVVAGWVERSSADGVPTWDGSTDLDFAVVRFKPDGTLDETFGENQNGIVVTDLYDGIDIAADIAIQPDGKIVVVGQTQLCIPGWCSSRQFAVVRYTEDGRLDNTFSSDGKQWIDFGGYDDFAYGVAIQPDDGKIIVVGEAGRGSHTDFGIARLHDDGTLDEDVSSTGYQGFSGDGKQTTDFLQALNDTAYAVALQSDGRIVVAGRSMTRLCDSYGNCSWQTDGALARYSSNGILDSTFGGIPGLRFGLRKTDFAQGNDGWKDVKLASGGKIVVAGYAWTGAHDDIAVARFDAWGDLDETFAGSGKRTQDFYLGSDSGEGLAIQPDGKILVAARVQGQFNTDFAVFRFLPDGQLDSRFGFQGTPLAGSTGIDFGFHDLASDVAVTSDGQIVVAGLGQGLLGADVVVARYTNDLGDRYDRDPRPNYGDGWPSPLDLGAAVDLGTVSGLREGEELNLLSIHEPGDEDWFRFEMSASAVTGHFVRIQFDPNLGDLDLELRDGSGQRVIAAAQGVSGTEEVSLGGLPAGEYFVRVLGFQDATNPEYSLVINAPWQPGPDVIDQQPFGNDTRTHAYHLGSLSGRVQVNGLLAERLSMTDPVLLSIHAGGQGVADVDWFRFQTTDTGSTRNFVRLDFNPLLGDLNMVLFDGLDWNAVLRGQSAGSGAREQISLEDLPAGVYYVGIYGAAGATNPRYSLTIDAPGGTIPKDRFEQNERRETATNLRELDGLRVLSADDYGLSVHGSSDEDWYRFQLTEAGAGGHYAAIAFEHTWGDLDLELYDSSGSDDPIRKSRGARSFEQISLNGLEKGVYFLRVRGSGGAVNPEYSLILNGPGKDFAERHTVVENGPNGPVVVVKEDNDESSKAFDLRTVRGTQTWGEQANPLSIHYGDADWFKFQLTQDAVEGHSASIHFAHVQGDLSLELYRDPSQSPTISNLTSDVEQVSLAGLTAKDALGQPITYYLKVQGSMFFGASDPDDPDTRAKNPAYSLVINAPGGIVDSGWVAEDWAERRPGAVDNNEPGRAYPLGEVRGLLVKDDPSNPLSIHHSTDEDWFSFQLPEPAQAGHFAAISFQQTEGDLDFFLYPADADGNADLSGGKSRQSATALDTEQITFAGLSAGKYFLHVAGHNGAINPQYSLLIRGPGANTPDILDREVAGGTNLGHLNGFTLLTDLSIDNTIDEDWFQFELDVPGRKGNAVQIEFDSSLGDLDLELVRPDWTTLRSQGSGNVENISLWGQPAGVYYVHVFGRKKDGQSVASNPSYTLGIDVPQSGGDWAERHAGVADNDQRLQAYDLREIDGSQTWSGLSIHTATDEDWFQFELLKPALAGHRVGIAFDQTLGDLDLSLYDRNGAAVLDDKDRPRQSATYNPVEEISLQGLPAGVYYVHIKGHRQAISPAYSLFVDAPSSLVAPDWSETQLVTVGEDTATGIVVLHDLEGLQTWSGLSLHDDSDVDYFAFFLPETGRDEHAVSIVFDHSLGNIDLGLLTVDGNGQLVALGASTNTSDREEISLNGVGPGAYAIVVLGKANPSYTLVINAPDPVESDWAETQGGRTDNDAKERALDLRMLDGPSSLQDLSITLGDHDWFQFQLPADGVTGQAVQIYFDGVDEHVQVELLKSSGGVVAATVVDGVKEISLAGLPADDAGQPLTYFLHVFGLDDDTKFNYSLALVPGETLVADWAEQSGGRANNDSRADAMDLKALDGKDFRLAVPLGERRYRDQLGSYGVFGSGFTPADLILASHITEAMARGMDNQVLMALKRIWSQMRPSSTPQDFANATTNLASELMYQNGYGWLADMNVQQAGEYGVKNFSDDYRMYKAVQRDIEQNFAPTGFNNMDFQGANQRYGINSGNLTQMDYVMNRQRYLGDPRQYGAAFDKNGLFDPTAVNFNNPYNNPWNSGGWGNSYPTFSPYPQQFSQSGYGRGFVYQTPPCYPFCSYAASPDDEYANAFSTAVLSDLSLDHKDDEDWLQFELPTDGAAGQFVALQADRHRGRLALSLYASDGVTLLDSQSNEGDEQRISLQGLPAGSFYLKVDSPYGDTHPNYALLLNIPRALEEDLAEPNNRGPGATAENGHDLRRVEGVRVLEGLSLYCDPASPATDGACSGGRDVDWFLFEINSPGLASHKVRIDFDHSQGDLELALFDAAGNPLTRDGQPLRSETSRNFEEISLEGLAVGTPHYIKVYGYAGQDGQLVTENPSYTLTVIAPDDTVRPDGFEPNNGTAEKSDEGTPTNLDHATGVRRITGLTIHTKETDGERDVDYFRFTVPAGAALTDRHHVGIEFDQEQGLLELEILDSANQPVTGLMHTNTTDYRSIALSGLLKDDDKDGRQDTLANYFVRVQAAGGAAAISNRYALNFNGPAAVASPQDAWTIMVYMTASDLGEFAFETINDLELAAAQLPSNVNLAVFYDQSGDQPYETPWWQDGRLVSGSACGQAAAPTGVSAWCDAGWAILQPDTDPDRVATTFERIGERNSGAPGTLTEFVNWATRAAPASRYGLVMWNHGAGVEGFNLDDRGGEAGDRMRARQMAEALQAAGWGSAGGQERRLDLIAFDACLMAMAEVQYALRSYTETLVASQDVEVATGYSYAAALSALAVRPDLVDGKALAANLVLRFQDRYDANPHGADTHSAADARKLETFGSKLRQFTDAAVQDADNQDWSILRDARLAAPSFQNHPEYRDVRQFAEALANHSVRSAENPHGLHATIRQAAAEVRDALAPLVFAKTTDGRGAGGLSIYLPKPGSDLSGYLEDDQPENARQHAAFFDATGWNAFLTLFNGQSPGAGISLDWAESNDKLPQAYNLHRLVGDGHTFGGLSIHRPDDEDWYRFFIQTTGEADDGVTVSLDNGASGQLQVTLYDPQQKTAITADAGAGRDAVLSLDGRAAGQYFVGVRAVGAELVSAYRLRINAPGSLSADDDAVRGNDRQSKAYRLGTIGGETLVSGLVAQTSSEDWYTFDTPKNQIFRSGDPLQNQWLVRIRAAEDQNVTAQLNQVGGSSGQSQPVSGSGELVLPYQTGSGASYELTVRSDSGQPVAYTLQMAPLTTLSTIAGVVYRDDNGDGTQQGGELGVADQTLFLDANENGLLDSQEQTATTDGLGRYSFENLLPGRYIVRAVFPDTWEQTAPASEVVSDFRLLASTSIGGDHPFSLVQLWTAPAAETEIGYTGFHTTLDFDPDGLLYGAAVSTLSIIDPADGSATIVGNIHRNDGTAIWVLGIAFAPDGRLYAVDDSSSLYVVDRNNGVATLVGSITEAGVSAIDFAPDGTLYATSWSNRLLVLDAETANTIATVGSIGIGMQDIDFAPDGFLYGVNYGDYDTIGDSNLYRLNAADASMTHLGTYSSSFNGVASEPTARALIPLPHVVALGVGEARGQVDFGVSVDITVRWQNPGNAFDVNDDGSVDARDVLLLVNYINAATGNGLPALPPFPKTPPPYLDVNDDNQVTPLDVLIVINEVNRKAAAGAEGQQATAPQPSPAAAWGLDIGYQAFARVDAPEQTDQERLVVSEVTNANSSFGSNAPAALPNGRRVWRAATSLRPAAPARLAGLDESIDEIATDVTFQYRPDGGGSIETAPSRRHADT